MTRLAMPRLYISLFCLFAAFYSSAHADLSDGLIGYWPLDGDALDHSVNQNDGTLLASASFVDNPTGSGQVLQNQAGAADTGHVQVGLPSTFHPGEGVVGFTTSGAFWVMFDDREGLENAPDWQELLGESPGILYVSRNLGSDRLYTMVKSVENGHISTKNTWPKSTPSSLSSEGRWYHIAWTFHSHNQGGEGHFRWYIDGVLNVEHTYGLQTKNTSDFRIGADYANRACNSKIAEVRLYDRILTETEVYELATTSRLSAGNYPAWWQIPTEGSLELAYALGTPEADYAPVAVGQLKYLAAKARDELDAVLAPVGGAGPEITAMVNAFSSGAPSDHGVANLGQLKFVASKFYDRFAEVGYQPGSIGWNTDIVLNKGAGDNSPLYPWKDDQTSENLSIALIGQSKFLFAWNLLPYINEDSNPSDGIPDWHIFYAQNLPTGEDYDGDTIPNEIEIATGTDPLNSDTDNDNIPDDVDPFPNNPPAHPLFITITNPIDGSTVLTSSIGATAQVTCNAGLEYVRINERLVFSSNDTFATILQFDEGLHQIRVTARSLEGVVENETVFFTVDAEPPSITIVNVLDNEVFNVPNVFVRARSDSDSLAVTINGSNAMRDGFFYSTWITLSSESNVITASFDDSGTIRSDSISVIYDEPAPTQDSDGDGVPDITDYFPNDPDEWSDTDGDGTGDNSDPDQSPDIPEVQIDSPADGAVLNLYS
jgi:hypothetical protein